MNSRYALLLRDLTLPDALIDCAMGRLSLPIASLASPADWFGFPPALCPVWSEASLPSYLGCWNHWFTHRPGSFVAMDVQSATVTEIARTPAQFFCYAIISAICVHDGVTPAIERFAHAVGVENLSEIDEVCLKTGDDPLGYVAISQFKHDIPLACVADPNEYTGWFPSGTYSGLVEWWKDACAYEVPKELVTSWPKAINKPIWLINCNLAEEFQTLLAARDFHGAWLILNSPGWTIPAAKGAIAALAFAANDQTFSRLAEAWVSVAHESSGGY